MLARVRSWVINIVAYYDIFCEVHPKRMRLLKSRDMLAEARQRLNKVTSE